MKKEQFGVGDISFIREVKKGKFELNIDLWTQKYSFDGNASVDLETLWNQLNFNPKGEPEISRAKVHYGSMPNVITASFICLENLEAFEERARELFKDKKNFLDIDKLKKELEEQQKEAKKARQDQNSKADEILASIE